MLDINSVESDDGCEESNVCFCDGVAEIIRRGIFGEMSFCFVEVGEEGVDGFFVGFLCSVK